MHLESIDIFAITRPSLQDFLGQEISNNFLLLRKIICLTNPSLQDLQNGAFYPVFSAKADYVPHILDADPCISSSNHGFAHSSTLGSPADPFDIRDHPSFFGLANGSFSPVGNLLCHNIGGFLPEDSEEKGACRFYLHIGSFGPWLPPPGKTITSSVLF